MLERILRVIVTSIFSKKLILLLLPLSLSAAADSPSLLVNQPANPGVTDLSECDYQFSNEIEVPDALCLSLIHQGDPLVKPRQMIQWTGQNFLIADMGGWVSGKGVIWRFDSNHTEFNPVITGLNVPHGLVRFGSDQIIIGERHQVSRIRLDSSFQVIETEVLLTKNDFGSHKHPLSSLVLDTHNNLILNVGAPTDQCRNFLIDGECRDRNEFAQVRRYAYDPTNDSWSKDYDVVGYGLRNSMALAVHQSGTVLQAENGMDFDRVHSPFETLNELGLNKDFGWPYCHSDSQSNVLWKESQACIGFDAPLALLPPHGAPLSMIYYQSDLIPSLTGKLIIPLHSYQKPGHRVLAVNVDSRGLPIINPEQQYQYSTPEGKQRYRSFPKAKGAEFEYLISDPSTKKSLSVSGVLEARDGSIYMLDDINKRILQITPR